ncbi:MAG TPA: GNAT family N-acetyltransferase [Byssovorax sp.]
MTRAPPSPAWKLEAAIRAPLDRAVLLPDTRVVEREGWFQILTPSAPRGMLNEVALSVIDERDSEHVIDEVVAGYHAIGQPARWSIGPWTRPLDLGERLERRGFEHWEMRGMGASAALDVAPGGVDVDEVTHATLDTFLDVSARGWDADATPPTWRAVHVALLEASPRVAHMFLASIDGEPIGTATLVMREGYGYLMGAQVLEVARGRGAYKAMLAARLACVREVGFDYAVTQAREATSAPILERLGFETLFRGRCYRLG